MSLVHRQLKQDASGHGFDHIQRVDDLSIQFASQLKVHVDLVRLIALLHDVDDYKLVGIEHANEHKNSRAIMKEAGVDLQTQKLVIENIQRLGYSKYLEGIRPTTLEGKLVSDADMCDAIGAIGILRVYAYGSSKGQPFFLKEAFPKEKMNANDYRKTGSDHTINHFFDKLLKLKSLMLTEPGKIEAQKRHQFLVNFLKQFFMEEKTNAWLVFLDRYLAKL